MPLKLKFTVQASSMLTKVFGCTQTSHNRASAAFHWKQKCCIFLFDFLSCWFVFVSVCAHIHNCMCTFLPGAWTAPLCRWAEGRKQGTLEEKNCGEFCVLRGHVEEKGCGCQFKLIIFSAGC